MDSTNKAEQPQGEGQQQQRYFDLGCNKNTPQMYVDFIELFVASSGVDPAGLHPLHTAANFGRTDIVQFMLSKGYDKDSLDDRGYTALHEAAEIGTAPVARILLAAGADSSHRCHTGMSPLDVASVMGQVDVARALLEHGVDANAPRPDGCTPLHAAATHDNPEVVALLCLKGADVDKSSDDRRSPLYVAAMGDRMAATQALLAAGADPSFRCGDPSLSPLDIAVERGHVDIARALLKHGADANAPGADGDTPLRTAAMLDKAGMVSLLCLEGADVDKTGVDGQTPLQVAALLGRATAARVLLAAGADVTLRPGGDGLSALGMAAAVVQYVDVLMAMIEHGMDVDDADDRGFTALHDAAVANKTAAMEVLLGAGADIEARGLSGTRRTPLCVAASMCNVSAVAMLLTHGASVSVRTAAERTPLHLAAAYAGSLGTAEVVDLLLRYGAEENAIDNDGRTPVEVVGSKVEEQDSVAEDVERVRKLLANAPADRAWRRRCFLVLCRAYYPSGRVRMGHGCSHARDASIAKRTRSRAESSRVEAEWAGVANMLVGAGADPISLMGDGADIIFKTIVGFL